MRGDFVPPSLLVADFPPALEHVICTALAIAPADRYASAAALLEALELVAAFEHWGRSARSRRSA